MGTAILLGLMSATLQRGSLSNAEPTSSGAAGSPAGSGTKSRTVMRTPPISISQIVVTARRAAEISRIRADVQAAMHDISREPQMHRRLHDQDDNHDGNHNQKQDSGPDGGLSVSVVLASPGNTTQAVQAADVVILCCKPPAYREVLGDAALREALLGGPKPKVLVSVLGGVSTLQLECCLGLAANPAANPAVNPKANPTPTEPQRRRCTIVRAIPNIAARIQKSMTVVVAPRTAHDNDAVEVVVQLFSMLGAVRQLPENQFDIASALASSAIAFYARLIASVAHGSDLTVQAGDEDQRMSPADALWITAHAAEGASGLILHGDDPDDIESQVATKGGSTDAGLHTMRVHKVEDTLKLAIAHCARKTATLSTVGKP